MYWGWSFLGMNFLWWIFWVLLIVAFFSFAPPMPRGRHLSALDLLQRRYASGELTTAEYEERKATLLRDRDLDERPAPPPPRRETTTTPPPPSTTPPLPQT